MNHKNQRVGGIDTEYVSNDERWDLDSNIDKLTNYSPQKSTNVNKITSKVKMVDVDASSPSVHLDQSFSPVKRGGEVYSPYKTLGSNKISSPRDRKSVV